MKPQTGFILYPTYTSLDEQTKIQLFGKLESGESFVSMHDFKPYFFIKEKDESKIAKYLKKYTVKKTSLKNFSGSPVLQIFAENQTELNKLYKAIHKIVDTYEADIKPHYRFMIDSGLLSTLEISGDSTSSERIDRIYLNPDIKPSKNKFSKELNIASIDIETSVSGEIYCLGIYSKKVKQVFMVTKHKIPSVIPCKSESDCLEKFKSALITLDPDIITGWNVIDFDLPALKARYELNKIHFDIGRTNSPVRLRIESNFFRASSADIPGRQVLDALNMIKDPFIKEAPSIKNTNFESYTLEDVSQALLKKGKLLKGKFRHEEIETLYKKNSQESHKKLAHYNLMDCQLVYEILEETKMISLALERSQLTGMPLDRLTASIAAFDSLYIREARARGFVSPTLSYGDKPERLKGGYVHSLNPGIYHNVLVFDFKSLYPSIIKTFNIDPLSQLDKPSKDSIETPAKAYFKNTSGVLPDIISKLHEARELAKKEKRELSSYAIKIIMNSFWGVLASPNCRYFNYDMASSITGFARFIIQLTAKEIEKKFKVSVIYADTDSNFVLSDKNKSQALALGLQIQDYINNFYKKYTKENYSRESFLELEFEKLYLSMMIPKLRGKEGAAKKRYAGLLEKNGKEEIEITGLEAIRGDWTDAAQDFQRALLDKVFHKQEIAKFIKSYIKELKSGKMDKKLIYSKSIRKNLSDYTKTTPPHVKAARKLPALDSNLIQYYITVNGPEPIQNTKSKIDYKHYIDKQIKPIAQQILSLFNQDFEDILSESQQAKLF